MSTAFAPTAPDQKAIVTVLSVEQRTVNKRDGTSFTMFDVAVAELPDHKLSTSKKPIAESAFELVNQRAEIAYVVKQNGEWTNYYLQGILPAPTSPALAAQRAAEGHSLLNQAAGLPVASIPSPALTAPPTGIPQASVSDWEQQKQASIHRQTAAKVAAVLVGEGSNSETFWANVVTLTTYFDTGTSPIDKAEAAVGGFPYSDDDIPFAPTLGPWGM